MKATRVSGSTVAQQTQYIYVLGTKDWYKYDLGTSKAPQVRLCVISGDFGLRRFGRSRGIWLANIGFVDRLLSRILFANQRHEFMPPLRNVQEE
jgi:hypothetical protein